MTVEEMKLIALGRQHAREALRKSNRTASTTVQKVIDQAVAAALVEKLGGGKLKPLPQLRADEQKPKPAGIGEPNRDTQRPQSGKPSPALHQGVPAMSGSKMLKCPGCGESHPKDDYEEVEKGAPRSFAAMAGDMAKVGNVLERDVLLSDLHRLEKRTKFGAGY